MGLLTGLSRKVPMDVFPLQSQLGKNKVDANSGCSRNGSRLPAISSVVIARTR